MTTTTVRRMKLGSQGLEVSAQGLGCMGMSGRYGDLKPEADMVALIRHVVDAGVTLLDTSDVYGPHTNELLGKALQGGEIRQKLVGEREDLRESGGVPSPCEDRPELLAITDGDGASVGERWRRWWKLPVSTAPTLDRKGYVGGECGTATNLVLRAAGPHLFIWRRSQGPTNQRGLGAPDQGAVKGGPVEVLGSIGRRST